MDPTSRERASRMIGAWLSRRQMLKGVAAVLIGRQGAKAVHAQPVVPLEQPTVAPPLEMPQVPVEQIPPTPTETPWQDTVRPTPTETPWATETPTPTETPWEMETEVPTEPAIQNKPAPVDPTRSRIAELCRAASEVLAEDLADRPAFDKHPHPDDAFGFLATLDRVARWGTNAQTWDDAMLANYVGSADSIAYAVRIGADAYYEVLKAKISREELPESDPDTCIFRELEKWRDCMANVAPDDALGRMTCFWDFTVLNSCRRCLRA